MISRLLIGLSMLMLATSSPAIDTGKAFDDPELQARYERLIAEVRCVTCQNQSIKDSNAPIASDLRREIRRMIAENMTDKQIADFLVTRYGDFVLYRPRFEGKLIGIWLAPALFLLLGGFILFRTVRHRMALPIDEDAVDKETAE